MSEAEGFLARWSRRKAEVQDGKLEPAEPPEPAIQPTREPQRPQEIAGLRGSPGAPGGASALAPRARAVDSAQAGDSVDPPGLKSATPLPTLDDVALLTRTSDYSRFVAPGVDPSVKNAAMKKLFSDPHFNVMDGLDTYIDDYGKADPIPESMVRRMVQSKFLGLFNDEDKGRNEGDAAEPALQVRTDAAPPLTQEEAFSAAVVASTDGAAALPLSQSDPAAGKPTGETEAPLS